MSEPTRETNKEAQQRVFDKAVLHCVRQGHQCSMLGGGCSYLNRNGDRCAIGGVVDLKTARELSDTFLFEVPGSDLSDGLFSEIDKLVCEAIELPLTRPNVELLASIQHAHDDCSLGSFRNNFLKQARAVAKTHKLKMPTTS